MARIIAGRFETQPQADNALAALRAAGIPAADCSSFYMTPPGQHAQYPIGGDAHHDEGTKDAGKGAGAGAVCTSQSRWLARAPKFSAKSCLSKIPCASVPTMQPPRATVELQSRRISRVA